MSEDFRHGIDGTEAADWLRHLARDEGAAPADPLNLCAHLQASLSAFEVWGGELHAAQAVLQHLSDTIHWRFSGAEGERPKLTFVSANASVETKAWFAKQTAMSARKHPIDFYEREFYPLSNFSAFTLLWPVSTREGWCRFDTSEAAYHWEKFNGNVPTVEQLTIQSQIRLALSAHDAFKIAESSRKHRRPNWDDEKVWVMRRIIRAKAEQHEYVRRKLLETGDRLLIEGSWRDDFWGVGPNKDGQNMLGKLWMELRAELRTLAPGSKGDAS